MKRIYIAGPFSGNNVIEILNNIRKGMRLATQVFLKGYSPFCPWLDFHFQLMLQEGETLSVDDYYRYSIDWLEVSDAMLVMPNSENSKGVQMELMVAKELYIPVFYSIVELINENISIKLERIRNERKDWEGNEK